LQSGALNGENLGQWEEKVLSPKVLYYNATSLLYIAQGIMSIAAGKFLQYAQNIGFQRSLAKGFFVRGDKKDHSH
jgi:hypothetical protein